MPRRGANPGWERVLGAGGAVGALVMTVACSGAPPVAGAAATTPPGPGLPMVISCEPHQRTIVRPTVVNGVAMSQVSCVAADAASPTTAPLAVPQQAVAAPAFAPAPVVHQAPAPAPSPRQYQPIADTQVVPVSSRTTVGQGHIVHDDERPRASGRSVGTSAAIIGSSAGVGAGVGAAIGGRKGALIGAAIGGGGAAVWDQVTRRKD